MRTFETIINVNAAAFIVKKPKPLYVYIYIFIGMGVMSTPFGRLVL